jgi:hypothetical protein
MSPSIAALRAAQERLARGENDLLYVTAPGLIDPTSVTSVTVTRPTLGEAIVTITLACARCGRDFTPKRPDARTCSGRCRTALYRERRS